MSRFVLQAAAVELSCPSCVTSPVMANMFLQESNDIDVSVCRGIVDTALNVLRPVPLIGSLAEKAGEILYGIQQYYTYTSAS